VLLKNFTHVQVLLKNFTHVQVLLKNFMDACIAALSFWLIGYAFAFGTKDNTQGEWLGGLAV
jgi:ammonia channel protein AmtB